MLKLCVIAFVFVLCSGGGIMMSYKIKLRLKKLVSIKNALSMLEGSIRFLGDDMEKALLEVGEQTNTSQIFSRASSTIKELGASRAWSEAVESGGQALALNDEDKHTLTMLCAKLGMVDEEEQIQSIERVLNILDVHISSARYDCEKYCRLYGSGGILVGAFIAMLFI